MWINWAKSVAIKPKCCSKISFYHHQMIQRRKICVPRIEELKEERILSFEFICANALWWTINFHISRIFCVIRIRSTLTWLIIFSFTLRFSDLRQMIHTIKPIVIDNTRDPLCEYLSLSALSLSATTRLEIKKIVLTLLSAAISTDSIWPWRQFSRSFFSFKMDIRINKF